MSNQTPEEITRFSEAWDRLWTAVGELEPGSVEVLAFIAERLVMGRQKYGDLQVNDGRNWAREFSEEMADGAVYAACALLQGSLG